MRLRKCVNKKLHQNLIRKMNHGASVVYKIWSEGHDVNLHIPATYLAKIRKQFKRFDIDINRPPYPLNEFKPLDSEPVEVVA